MALIPLGFWAAQEGIITTNLIFYYDPSNPSSYSGSGTTLSDLSTNAYTATLSGGYGFNGSDGGGSLTFDGVNARANINNSTGAKAPFINQSFTVEAWLKPSLTSPPSVQVYFSILQDATTGSRLHFRFADTGEITMAYFGDDLVSSASQVSFGSWQHVVMRYRSTDDTSTIFKNGVQIVQGNNGPLQSSTGADIWIGSFGNTEYWKGSIGAIYAYQASLTDSQIVSNYNALKSRYGL